MAAGNISERIALAVSGSEDGIWDWDLRTGEMYLSPQWKRIIGYQDYELPNAFETWARMLHPEDVAGTTKQLAAYIEGRSPTFRAEFRQQHRDGTSRWVLSQGSALRDASGRAYRVAGSHTDITARKQAELERDRFFTLARDPLCIVGADGRFIRVNPAFEKVLGWSPNELIGTPWQALVHPDDKAAGGPILSSEERHHNFENRYRRIDGTYRWLSWSAVRSEEETIYGTARDVTERKDAEVELARARDLALESARLKSEFLANMSHEIRTPMNGVIGMATLLRDTPIDEAQRRYVEAIVTSADALLVLINDILDFSKIEAGKMTLESIDVDLRALLEDVVELLAERAEQKHLVLSLDLDPRMPAYVLGDLARLRQIMTNLVGNAVKFTERGEVVVRVRVVGRGPRNVELRVEVADTGIGMSAEAMARLFSPFTQADGSTTRRYGGTGLGLVICQRLAHLMDTRIEVDSRPGAGSCFSFRLWLGLSERAFEAPCARGRRVLCVSPHDGWRAVLTRHVAALGAEAIPCETAADARRQLDQAGQGPTFDAVLCTLPSAAEDGETLYAHVCELLGAATVPVVFAFSWLSAPKLNGALALLRRRARVDALTLPLRERRLGEVLHNLWAQPLRDRAHPQPTAADAATSVSAATHASRPVQASDASEGPGAANDVAAPPRVLLVEDNYINQQVAQRLLERLGCVVEVAADGRTGVARVAEGGWSLVLMDCQMPNMDGFEATGLIREHERAQGSARVPVIALTANAMLGDRERCLQAGMDDYVTKPISKGELERVLGVWTSRGAAAYLNARVA